MPRPKSMIKKSLVEIAKAKRTCVFSNAEIPKGAVSLVLFEDSRDRYVYCKEVALQMIQKARERLATIERAIKDGSPLE